MSPKSKTEVTSDIENNDNTSLALPKQYFDENVNVGLSSLSTDDVPIPSLSIVQSTSKMRDESGRPFVPGKLFYKALRQEFSIVECSILVITKKEMPSYTDRNVMERTYVVLGCILPTQMPFLMFSKGSSYFAVRSFIGEVKARKYPMYALKVQVSTEKRQNDSGEWYVPVFTIVGIQTDPSVIVTLEALAKEYDSNQHLMRSEEEEQVVVKQAEQIIGEDANIPVEEGIDIAQIPF